jgi:hypothetical protein
VAELELENMPEGCQAEIVWTGETVSESSGNPNHPVTRKKVIRVFAVCGERHFPYQRAESADNAWDANLEVFVKPDVEILLGGMCMGCPNNSAELHSDS